MRRIMYLALLALALPTAALANSIDFSTGTFVHGTINRVSNGGFADLITVLLNGSSTQIHLSNGVIPVATAGTACFVAGDGSCTFTGGTITVLSSNGLTTLFSDSIVSGTIKKTATTATISAILAPNSGTPSLGSGGGLVFYSVSFSATPSSNLLAPSVGRVAAVPEPGALEGLLLGTGLLGLVEVARRKLQLGT